MKKIYLLLKTHKVTGLKYLCRHETLDEKTCFVYPGSGVYWRRHLDKHGYDLTTEILAICETSEEFKVIGIHYSHLYDIVSSKEFANLVIEEGQGGSGPAKMRKHYCGWRGLRMMGEDNPSKKDSVRKKISQKLKGRVLSDDWKQKLSAAAKKRTVPRIGHLNENSIANIKKMNSEKLKCPYCDKIGTIGGMTRWHFENCKNKQN